MRRTAISLLLCCASLSAQAGGQVPCTQPVRFSAAWFPDPEIDQGKSSAELDGQTGMPRASGTQLGHVVVKTQLTVEPQASCNGLVVRLDFVEPMLRIAREVPAGTCSHALVMAHEQTHVRIHREIARQFRALDYPWPQAPTPAAVLAFAKHQLARLMDAQRRFDSPQEYARSRTACSGEVLQLLKAGAPAQRAP